MTGEGVELAKPPRAVPLALQVRVAFDDALALAGWIVFGIGVVVATVILHFAEPLRDPFAGEIGTSEGKVVTVDRTNTRVNNRSVLAVHFAYRAEGRDLRGVGYTTDVPPEPGESVAVDYVPGDPATARIDGMRTAVLPRPVWFVALVPAIGAALLLFGVVRGLRRVRLLRDGVAVAGRLIATRATNVRINNRPVMELTFRFVDDAGHERTGTLRTHRVERVSDDEQELLLHDPASGRIVPWDALPRVEVDRDGHLLAPGLRGLLPVLLPATGIALVWTVLRALLPA